MKTIFITSYHGLIARNILETDILPILNAHNIKIVILVPPSKTDYFRDNFKDKSIEVIGIKPKENFLDGWLYFVSIALVSVENLFIWGLRRKRRYIKFYTAHLIYYLFSKIFIFKKVLRLIFRTFARKNTYIDLFNQYKPDLVFSTDIYDTNDRDLTEEAKRYGVLTIGMVRSWDNVTTKGVMLAIPDKIIVASNILRDELWEYNKIKKDKIFISGIPHYDACLNPREVSREKFFEEMKLDLGKKVIIFCPTGARQYQYDGETLKLFQDFKDRNLFSKRVQFLVRFPPSDTIKLNGFIRDPDFVFDEPGLNINGVKKESEFTREDAGHLNDSLYYSDIVITTGSTMMIDAAAFNRPSILLFFDAKKDNSDGIKKFSSYMHLKKFLRLGSCRIAKNSHELLEQINNYLDNPILDAEKRKKMLEEYCYKLDGKSSNRVSQFLLTNLD